MAKKEKGHNLVELLIVLVIVSLLTISILALLQQRIRNAKMNQMLKDLEAITKAGRDYYKATQTVPASITDLVSNGYLPNITPNPYGRSYTISAATGDIVSVRTTVPAGTISSRMDSRLTVTSAGPGLDRIDFLEPIGYNLPAEKFEKTWLYED